MTEKVCWFTFPQAHCSAEVCNTLDMISTHMTLFMMPFIALHSATLLNLQAGHRRKLFHFPDQLTSSNKFNSTTSQIRAATKQVTATKHARTYIQKIPNISTVSSKIIYDTILQQPVGCITILHY